MPKVKKNLSKTKNIKKMIPQTSFAGKQKAKIVEEKKTLLTREGLKKLVEELDYLSNVRRKEVAERIKEAISYGDLSENSEYEDAKNEQAFAEGRILELEEMIKSVEIIDEKHDTPKIVQLGAIVVLKNLTFNGRKEEFTIVGSTETDPITGKISNESPVGSALLEKAVGDLVEVPCPAGIVKYEIVGLK